MARPSGGAAGVAQSLYAKAVAGPISGFVQRGEMMLDRMRQMKSQANFKAFRREALRLRDTAKKLELLTATCVQGLKALPPPGGGTPAGATGSHVPTEGASAGFFSSGRTTRRTASSAPRP